MAPDSRTASAGEPSPAGAVNIALSNAIVRLHRDYLGRGPTRTRTSIRDDVVVVVMHDTLTKAERSLAEDGKRDEVLFTRSSLQSTMRNDMVAAVEQILSRRVVAFLSSNHIDPDLACEVFVLAPAPDDPNEPPNADDDAGA